MEKWIRTFLHKDPPHSSALSQHRRTEPLVQLSAQLLLYLLAIVKVAIVPSRYN